MFDDELEVSEQEQEIKKLKETLFNLSREREGLIKHIISTEQVLKSVLRVCNGATISDSLFKTNDQYGIKQDEISNGVHMSVYRYSKQKRTNNV